MAKILTHEEKNDQPVTQLECIDARARCCKRWRGLGIVVWSIAGPIIGWLAIQAFADHEKVVRQEERIAAYERTMEEVKVDLREIKSMLMDMKRIKAASVYHPQAGDTDVMYNCGVLHGVDDLLKY